MPWCLLVIVALMGLTACSEGSPDTGDASRGTVVFDGGGELQVRIADSDEERRRGLMGVSSLKPDRGMAFVFDEPTDGSFWMKDTLIPLSIAFVDEEDLIVTIHEMEPCRADPCPTYEPARPYVLAVEANAGWFAAHGVAEGDRMEEFRGPARQ